MAVETFDTPGNGAWTWPAGVTTAFFEVIGPGGDGGTGEGGTGGGGGGGGGYANKTIIKTSSAIDYNVGSNDSGDYSWVGTDPLLDGGAQLYAGPGGSGLDFNGGQAGTDNNGDITHAGAYGGSSSGTGGGGGGGSGGSSSDGNTGTNGSGSSGGAGGVAVTDGGGGGNGGDESQNGIDGEVPGGGGGAAGDGGSPGVGADGRVRVTYTEPVIHLGEAVLECVCEVLADAEVTTTIVRGESIITCETTTSVVFALYFQEAESFGGGYPFTNLDNLLAYDGQYATVDINVQIETLNESDVVEVRFPKRTDLPDIPDVARITGIEVQFLINNFDGQIIEPIGQWYDSEGPITIQKSNLTSESGETQIALGSNTDTWNLSLYGNDIDDLRFRFLISMGGSTGVHSLGIETVRVVFTWSLATFLVSESTVLPHAALTNNGVVDFVSKSLVVANAYVQSVGSTLSGNCTTTVRAKEIHAARAQIHVVALFEPDTFMYGPYHFTVAENTVDAVTQPYYFDWVNPENSLDRDDDTTNVTVSVSAGGSKSLTLSGLDLPPDKLVTGILAKIYWANSVNLSLGYTGPFLDVHWYANTGVLDYVGQSKSDVGDSTTNLERLSRLGGISDNWNFPVTTNDLQNYYLHISTNTGGNPGQFIDVSIRYIELWLSYDGDGFFSKCTVTANGSTDAGETIEGASNLSAFSTLTPATQVAHKAITNISDICTITSAAQAAHKATTNISDICTTSQAGRGTYSATTNITGICTITSTSTIAHKAVTVISAICAMTGTSIVVHKATTNISGICITTQTGKETYSATTNIASVCTDSIVSATSHAAITTISTICTVVPTAKATHKAACNITAICTIAAVGATQGAVELLAYCNATCNATGAVTHKAHPNIIGNCTTTQTSRETYSASTNITGNCTTTQTSRETYSASTNITGNCTTTQTSRETYSASTNITGNCTTTQTSRETYSASTNITGNCTTTQTSRETYSASTNITGNCTISQTVFVTHKAASSTTSNCITTQTGREIYSAAANITAICTTASTSVVGYKSTTAIAGICTLTSIATVVHKGTTAIAGICTLTSTATESYAARTTIAAICTSSQTAVVAHKATTNISAICTSSQTAVVAHKAPTNTLLLEMAS